MPNLDMSTAPNQTPSFLNQLQLAEIYTREILKYMRQVGPVSDEIKDKISKYFSNDYLIGTESAEKVIEGFFDEHIKEIKSKPVEQPDEKTISTAKENLENYMREKVINNEKAWKKELENQKAIVAERDIMLARGAAGQKPDERDEKGKLKPIENVTRQISNSGGKAVQVLTGGIMQPENIWFKFDAQSGSAEFHSGSWSECENMLKLMIGSLAEKGVKNKDIEISLTEYSIRSTDRKENIKKLTTVAALGLSHHPETAAQLKSMGLLRGSVGSTLEIDHQSKASGNVNVPLLRLLDKCLDDKGEIKTDKEIEEILKSETGKWANYGDTTKASHPSVSDIKKSLKKYREIVGASTVKVSVKAKGNKGAEEAAIFNKELQEIHDVAKSLHDKTMAYQKALGAEHFLAEKKAKEEAEKNQVTVQQISNPDPKEPPPPQVQIDLNTEASEEDRNLMGLFDEVEEDSDKNNQNNNDIETEDNTQTSIDESKNNKKDGGDTESDDEDPFWNDDQSELSDEEEEEKEEKLVPKKQNLDQGNLADGLKINLNPGPNPTAGQETKLETDTQTDTQEEGTSNEDIKDKDTTTIITFSSN